MIRLRSGALPAALLFGGLVAILVSAGGVGSTPGVREGGIFRVTLNAASGIDYIDPALASSPPGWALLDTTCARLMAYPDKPPPEGFRLQPEVAASFPAVSRDRKTYTFRLRSGFRFSNGTPVRASAFARAINRTLAPEMNSPAVQLDGEPRIAATRCDRLAGVQTHPHVDLHTLRP